MTWLAPAVERLDSYQEQILEALEFRAHEAQRPILACQKRFELISGGGQSGKSLVVSKAFQLRWQLDLARHLGEDLLYWLVAEDYGKNKAEFDYIVEDLIKLWGRHGKNNKYGVEATDAVNPGRIRWTIPNEASPTGEITTEIETKSANDPRSLAMHAPHGVMICEASQVSFEVFNRIINERLAPRRGWGILSGTLELGSSHGGWFPSVLKAWLLGTKEAQAFKLPTWTNTTLFPGGRQDPEILRLERENSEEFFMERIAGEPVPPRGLVFREFNAAIHIKPGLEFDYTLPLYLWEDPGYGSESAHALEFVQIKEGQIQVIDEIYWQGHITQEVIYEAMKRPQWAIKDKKLVSDPHYKDAHHSTTSVAEIWLASPAKLHAFGERIRIMPGIERLKSFLKVNPQTMEPGIVIHPRCVGILSEFGIALNPFDKQLHAYKWKTDQDGNTVGDTPEDRWNHGIKAIIYGIVDRFGFARDENRQKFIVRRFGKPIEGTDLPIRERMRAGIRK